MKYAFLEEQRSSIEIIGQLKLEGLKSKISYSTIYHTIYAGWFDTPEERFFHGRRDVV